MNDHVQLNLNDIIEDFADFREGLSDDSFGLDLFLLARVKKIGLNGWLGVNAVEQVESLLVDDAIEAILRKSGGELVRFIDDAWADGRLSVMRISDDDSIDERLFHPLSDENIPIYDGSEYQTKNVYVKAVHLSSESGERDLTIYGGAGLNLSVRRKIFQFDERDNSVTLPSLPILQLGDEWVFFRWAEHYFIFNEKRFEEISGNSEMIASRANEAINGLLAVPGVRFRTIDTIQSALGNKEFARKLAAAHAQGVFDDLTPDNLHQDIVTNEIALDFDFDGTQIVLDPDLSTRESRRDFVDLLVESLFVSRRGTKYRALQKTQR